MEVWDIYDENRVNTGRTITRDKQKDIKEGEYGLVVHVAIFNTEGEMLIQKRQTTKKKFPNCWDISAGGHSITGENSKEAITRELHEELGIEHDFSKDRPFFTINYIDGFGDIYIISNFDVNLEDLKLQEEEVQEVKWASKEKIEKLLESGEFIPYSHGFIELLFFNRDNRGVINRKKL